MPFDLKKAVIITPKKLVIAVKTTPKKLIMATVTLDFLM
jgi:hypothetical protein